MHGSVTSGGEPPWGSSPAHCSLPRSPRATMPTALPSSPRGSGHSPPASPSGWPLDPSWHTSGRARALLEVFRDAVVCSGCTGGASRDVRRHARRESRTRDEALERQRGRGIVTRSGTAHDSPPTLLVERKQGSGSRRRSPAAESHREQKRADRPTEQPSVLRLREGERRAMLVCPGRAAQLDGLTSSLAIQCATFSGYGAGARGRCVESRGRWRA